MNDVAKSIALERFDNGVDVVWHDAPREHAIALTIEVQNDILNQLCNGWLAEPARP